MNSKKIITSVLTISLVVTNTLGQDPRPGNDDPLTHFATELMKANNISVPGGIGPPSGGQGKQSESLSYFCRSVPGGDFL